MAALDAIKAKNNGGMDSPEVERAKQAVRFILNKAGVSPEVIVQAGKLADEALEDPSKTQEALQVALQEGLIEKNFIVPGHEKGLLALAATAGKLAQMIIDEDSR